MGRPKAWLPFGPQTMLQRVVHAMQQALGPICVVAAAGQPLPNLPPGILVARDEQEGLGPLAGLLVGLQTLRDVCPAAFATSCDVPFLQAGFVQAVCQRLAHYAAAVPTEEGFFHPLAAAYTTRCADVIAKLLAAGRRRPADLFAEAPTLRIPVEELRSADPELASLRNLNDPQAYLTALRDAGFAPPEGDWPEVMPQGG